MTFLPAKDAGFCASFAAHDGCKSLGSIGGGAERNSSGLAGAGFFAAAAAAAEEEEEEGAEAADEEDAEEAEEEEAVFCRLLGLTVVPGAGVLSGNCPVARISARRFLRLEADGAVVAIAYAGVGGLGLPPAVVGGGGGRLGLGRNPSARPMP